MPGEKKEYELKQIDIRIRAVEGSPFISSQMINSPERAVDVMAKELSQYDREVACIVNLDTKMHPLNFSIVGMGSVNSAPISMTNVFKSAVLSNSAYIMLFHNHPSGDVTPSPEDRHLTQKLMEACRIMDIPLVDHVIIGGTYGHRYSFKESSDLFVDMPQAKGVRGGSGQYKVSKKLCDRIAEKSEAMHPAAPAGKLKRKSYSL